MIQQLSATGLLAQGDDQGIVSVWQRRPGDLLWSSRVALDGHRKAITTLAWSPDGRFLASGSVDRTIKVWDAVTGVLLFTYDGHPTSICALAWSPDQRQIVSSAEHGGPHLWKPILSHEH